MCDPSTTHLFSWEILPNQYGSDHLPILITHNQDVAHTPTQSLYNKWKLDKANWAQYTILLEEQLSDFKINVDNINATTKAFQNTIINVATSIIGKKSNKT